MTETFELYHKSGKRRTIRRKAWGLARDGILRRDSWPHDEEPLLFMDKEAAGMRRCKEKVVELEVTIKVKE